MSTFQSIPERVPLYSRDCRTRYCYLTGAEAREMISQGKVKPMGTKSRIRAVRWLAPGEPRDDEKPGGARRAYSHKRETEQNPHGVWTLVHLKPEEQALFQGWRERVA